METKKCSKCGEVIYLGKNKYQYYCKICRTEYCKQWRSNNIEKQKQYTIKSRLKNHEKNKEATNKWKMENREKANEITKNWKRLNPEKVKDANSYYLYALRKSGFTTEQINENPELIEVKRLIIKTKRLCKTLPTSEKA